MVWPPKWFLGKTPKSFMLWGTTCSAEITYWPHRAQLVAFVNEGHARHSEAYNALRRKENQVPAIPQPGQNGEPELLPHAEGESWSEEYPTLTGYLTDPMWPDKRPRQPAKIFIVPQSGLWKFTLKEPNLDLVLDVITADPAKGLELLEAALKHPTPPWRSDPWAKPQKKRK